MIHILFLQVDTSDVEAFGRATAGLKFESYDGGRDSRERMTQVSHIFILCHVGTSTAGSTSGATECLP